MAHREFTDTHGVLWQVWDVIPQTVERRVRIPSDTPWPGVERRKNEAPRAMLAKGHESGWLAFECGTERRRLRPIPPRWETRSDVELEQLCNAAAPVERTRKRLIE
jgi:hypothetical protein